LKHLEEKAIPTFEQMHPEACGLFMFDNSTNHGVFEVGAVVCSKVNLNSGGKICIRSNTKSLVEINCSHDCSDYVWISFCPEEKLTEIS
jgi:hypothetical protein